MSTAASTYGEAAYVTVQRAAKALSLSARTVRDYAATNTIPARRVGRHWLVPVSWLRGG